MYSNIIEVYIYIHIIINILTVVIIFLHDFNIIVTNKYIYIATNLINKIIIIKNYIYNNIHIFLYITYILCFFDLNKK